MSDDPIVHGSGDAFLTLEPLLETLRAVVVEGGWELSGLQKTTSYQYEGRWAGEATRSAYLFFHPAHDARDDSIDAFLDETTRGLVATLTLVLGGPPLDRLGDVGQALERLRQLAIETRTTPELLTGLSVRAALPSASLGAGEAGTGVRIKVRVPATAIDGGGSTVSAVVRTALDGFARLRADPRLRELLGVE